MYGGDNNCFHKYQKLYMWQYELPIWVGHMPLTACEVLPEVWPSIDGNAYRTLIWNASH